MRSVYRADRFRFRTRLQPVASAPASSLPPGAKLRLATPADAPAWPGCSSSAWRAGYGGIVDPAVLDALDEEDIADWLGTLDLVQRAHDLVGRIRRRGRAWPFRATARTPSTAAGAISSRCTSPPRRAAGAWPRRCSSTISGCWPNGAAHRHPVGVRGEPGRPRPVRLVRFRPDGGRRVEPQYGAQENPPAPGHGRARRGRPRLRRARRGRVGRAWHFADGRAARLRPMVWRRLRAQLNALCSPRGTRRACPWP